MKYFLYTSTLLFILQGILHSEEFFPLNIGNSWQYKHYRVYSDSSIQSDTIFYEVSVLNKYFENDTLYYEISNSFSQPYQSSPWTLRRDTTTQELINANDCLWMDLRLDIGDTIFTNCSFPFAHYISNIDSSIHFNLYRETHIYQQTTVHLQLQHTDYHLFEGIGPIQIEEHDALYVYSRISKLIAAEINGIVYGEFVYVDPEVIHPLAFKLMPAFPNPFNPKTTISFITNKRAHVKLIIFDICGRRIEMIINKDLEPDYYKINWNASELSSGIYILQLIVGSNIKTQKLILMK